MPLDATALVASGTGYLVDVDLRGLVRAATSAGCRVRICQAIGAYVNEGEVIGWASSDDGRPLDVRLLRMLTAPLEVSPVREPDYDPALGVRIITDVANRSLSSSANNPYTARQALNQVRLGLQHIGPFLWKIGIWSTATAR